MKKILFSFLPLMMSLAGSAQSFEGVIEFSKITFSDTVSYKYYVKDLNVRIEELDKKGNTTGIMLVNPKDKTVKALNTERKLYMMVPNNQPPVMKGKPEVIKTTTTKEVAGQKCTLWRVKNTEENTEIGYWVAEGKYDFFLPLIKTLNRKDKLGYYFLSIDGNNGVFPFEATEKSLLRKDVGSLKVSKIEKMKVDPKMFAIPSDYKKFEK